MQIKTKKFVMKFLSMDTKKLLFILFTSFFLFSFFVTIPTHTYHFDEGWAADIGNNIANGKVLYEDISAPYGPVVFYIYAFLISLFGKQFFIFRVVGSLIIMLQAYFTTKIVRLYTEEKSIIISSAFISLLSLGLYQGCRITASTVAGLITLMIAFYHLCYIKNKNRKLLVCMGVLFAIQLLTKHNVFAIDVAANGLFMILRTISLYKKEYKIDWGYFLITILAFIAFLTPYVIYIFPYYNILLNDTILTISEYKSSDITIPFPSPLDLIKMNLLQIRLSLFLYSIFPIIIAGVIVYYNIFKEKNKIHPGLIFLFIITVAHYFEIYPLSDYSHYTRATVLYPSFICLLVYLSLSQKKNRIVLYCIISGLFLHLYSSPINLYSSIKSLSTKPISSLPYHKNIRKISNEDEIVNILKNIRSLESEKILIIGHANVYYYLADRTTSSRFSMITHSYLDNKSEEKIIKEIKINNITHIIEASSVRSLKDLDQLIILNDYINNNFILTKNIDGFNFWSKK